MKTKTLFLVEDDLRVAEMVFMYAETNGYRIVHAHTLETVRHLLSEEFTEEGSIDAFLVDLMFPKGPEGNTEEINGDEAIRMIREYSASKGYREPRMAIATGRADLALGMKEKLGVEIIPKPYRINQLTELIEGKPVEDIE